MKKIIFLFVVLGLASVGFALIRSGMFDWRTICRFLDLEINSSARLQESRLGAYLDERAGSCVFRERSAWTETKGEEQFVVLTRTPFAQPFLLRSIREVYESGETTELRYVGYCRDGLGNEVRIKTRSGRFALLKIDRAIGHPLRLAFFSASAARLVGKDLRFILQSPLGNLEVRSLGNAEVGLDFRQDAAGNLSTLVIGAIAGEVQLTRVEAGLLRGDAGVVELLAEKGGRLRWENEQKMVTHQASALVAPSGVYWRNPEELPPNYTRY